jgi:hypothetical protein
MSCCLIHTSLHCSSRAKTMIVIKTYLQAGSALSLVQHSV